VTRGVVALTKEAVGVRISGVRMEVGAAIRDRLVEARVTLAASLPDDWVAPIIESVDADESITHVRVARESEIVGICCGGFVVGRRSVAIMGGTGLMAAACEFATISERHAIPLFVLSSLRGDGDDLRVYQEVQGRRLLPYLRAFDIPYQIVSRHEDIDRLTDYYEHSRIQKRPYIVFFTKRVLAGAR
jgi:sulfopyruvate decarboxylase subunit alpha